MEHTTRDARSLEHATPAPMPPGVVGSFHFTTPPPKPWPGFLAGQPGRPVRVLAVDDAGHVLSVVAPELMADRRTVLVGRADTLREGRRLAAQGQYDVLLAGASLPDGNGLDLVVESRRRRPAAEVIVLASTEEEADALHAFELGANGYLARDSWFGNYVQAVLQVANGGAVLSPTLQRRLMQRFTRGEGLPQEDPQKISGRESEVLRLLAEGLTLDAIAVRLAIGRPAVQVHMRHLYDKLHVRNRMAAIDHARSRGLL